MGRPVHRHEWDRATLQVAPSSVSGNLKKPARDGLIDRLRATRQA